ncbi:hypothetical protein [Halomonas sp. BN3-1]|uniref:hypothetical protein n=1 Tax=Halomonas sp. BN3-1 TaxID=2082393 RepID=UPI000D3443CD|nr:hypothetical protein [Halomonas sp. BN3-1]
MNRATIRKFPDIERAREHYLAEVDRVAAQGGVEPTVRARREQKYQEALAGGGPFLHAEAEALGVPLQQVIDAVLDARREADQAEAQAEAARIAAKSEIRKAGTVREMQRALSGLK